MIHICQLPYRCLIRINGCDSYKFINALVTASIEPKDFDRLVYGAFLRPQGKIITDALFWLRDEDSIWIEVAENQAESLVKSLNIYRLRAEVDINRLDLPVHAVFSQAPLDNFLIDPRNVIVSADSFFGRYYGECENNCTSNQWINFKHNICLTEFGDDLNSDKFYGLDVNLDLLNGIDFHKGCYVGQELTSRMKRRGQIKNRLCTILSETPIEAGTDIYQNNQNIGNVITFNNGLGLALIRVDRYHNEATVLCADQNMVLHWQAWQLPLDSFGLTPKIEPSP